jgi:hypothetical protein
MVHSNVWKFEKNWLSGTLIINQKSNMSLFSKRKRAIAQERWNVYHTIQLKFDYGVFHIYSSWVMALYLLENRDCYVSGWYLKYGLQGTFLLSLVPIAQWFRSRSLKCEKFTDDRRQTTDNRRQTTDAKWWQ